MSDSVLNYDDIVDARYNPYTDVWTAFTIGTSGNPAEVRTVPASSPYWIKTFEIPEENQYNSPRYNL